MKSWLLTLGDWFDARLGVRAVFLPMMRHPVPRALEGPLGWWYVFGSASLTLFLIQIITGIGLSLVYVPAADKAYESLLYLDYEQPLGWFLRALHYYAGSGMVVMLLVHMTQVFMHGAYKYPRELTWVVGVFLLACVLGMFFSGQILRWDPDAYWGLAVGAFDGRPRAGDRPLGRRHAARRTDHRRRFAQSLLHAARVRDSRCADVFRLRAFVARSAVRRELPARTWSGRRSQDLRRRLSPRARNGRGALPGRRAAQRHFVLGAGGDRGRRHRRHGRSQGANRPARSGAGGRESPSRMAVLVDLCAVVAQSASHRDVHHAGVADRDLRGPARGAVR